MRIASNRWCSCAFERSEDFSSLRYNCTIGLPAYYSRRLEQEAKEFRDNDLKRIFEADTAVTAVWTARS